MAMCPKGEIIMKNTTDFKDLRQAKEEIKKPFCELLFNNYRQ